VCLFLGVFSDESSTRSSFLFSGQVLLGSVENLQQRINSVSHASVQVRLGALNVVVQVVTESLDHIDGLVLLGLREVSIE